MVSAPRSRARDLRRRRHQLITRDDPLDEAPVVRGLRADEVAAEIEQVGAAEPDEPRQPLRAAAAGDEPELDLGLAQLRVVGADPHVAAHRELESAAEAEAVDRGDERSPRRIHSMPDRVQTPCGAALAAAGLAKRRELLDVGARDERPLAGAEQHDRARLVVAVEPVDLLLELLQQRRRELVHGRVLDRDERDRALVPRADERPHRASSV